MVTSTWQDREQRILVFVVDAYERGERPDAFDVAEAMALDRDAVVRILAMLRADGYLTARSVVGEKGFVWIEPAPKALRAVEQWPTPETELYDRLIAVLDERIADETDAHKRGRLQRARDALADVGRNVVAGALVEAMKFGAGLSV